MDTDRIEKRVVLKAPRARVWKALTDHAEFSEWFGVTMEGPFTPGARLKGKITFKGYENSPFALTIERMEPERLFSWRWHPNAHDPNVDYSSEPTTLVVFELEETAEGTLLTVVESGFDAIPLKRRLEAFGSNEKGWVTQMKAIEQYVSQAG